MPNVLVLEISPAEQRRVLGVVVLGKNEILANQPQTAGAHVPHQYLVILETIHNSLNSIEVADTIP